VLSKDISDDESVVERPRGFLSDEDEDDDDDDDDDEDDEDDTELDSSVHSGIASAPVHSLKSTAHTAAAGGNSNTLPASKTATFKKPPLHPKKVGKTATKSGKSGSTSKAAKGKKGKPKSKPKKKSALDDFDGDDGVDAGGDFDEADADEEDYDGENEDDDLGFETMSGGIKISKPVISETGEGIDGLYLNAVSMYSADQVKEELDEEEYEY
jgi:hypothetical protein